MAQVSGPASDVELKFTEHPTVTIPMPTRIEESGSQRKRARSARTQVAKDLVEVQELRRRQRKRILL